jgi:hypothetical protein
MTDRFHNARYRYLATVLIVALGSLQHWRDGFVLMGRLVLMLVINEPLRVWRMREKSRNQTNRFKHAA